MQAQLDDQQPFVAGGCVFQGEGVIVGDKDSFIFRASRFPATLAMDGKAVVAASILR